MSKKESSEVKAEVLALCLAAAGNGEEAAIFAENAMSSCPDTLRTDEHIALIKSSLKAAPKEKNAKLRLPNSLSDEQRRLLTAAHEKLTLEQYRAWLLTSVFKISDENASNALGLPLAKVRLGTREAYAALRKEYPETMLRAVADLCRDALETLSTQYIK